MWHTMNPCYASLYRTKVDADKEYVLLSYCYLLMDPGRNPVLYVAMICPPLPAVVAVVFDDLDGFSSIE